MKVRETDAGHSDLDSAFKMLNRAGKSSAGKPSGAAPSGEPKGSPAAGAIFPEAANADAKKLHEIFADLFMTELDFEADLLRNLQIDQARDDDIDDQLAKISKVENQLDPKLRSHMQVKIRRLQNLRRTLIHMRTSSRPRSHLLSSWYTDVSVRAQ